jgi:hypothetical protein
METFIIIAVAAIGVGNLIWTMHIYIFQRKMTLYVEEMAKMVNATSLTASQLCEAHNGLADDVEGITQSNNKKVGF